MPNGTYGGVRGKETKAGQKAFVSRPTRFYTGLGICTKSMKFALYNCLICSIYEVDESDRSGTHLFGCGGNIHSCRFIGGVAQADKRSGG